MKTKLTALFFCALLAICSIGCSTKPGPVEVNNREGEKVELPANEKGPGVEVN